MKVKLKKSNNRTTRITNSISKKAKNPTIEKHAIDISRKEQKYLYNFLKSEGSFDLTSERKIIKLF